MNAEIDDERDVACFTIIWSIKNYSELPCFRVHSPWFVWFRDFTIWSLSLVDDPDSGKTITCRIERHGTGEENININFDIEIIGADGSPLVTKSGEKCFEKYSKSEYLPLVTKIATLNQKGTFLPNDTFTVRCQLRQKSYPHWYLPWKAISFARTVLGVEKREFFWKINEFSRMLPRDKRSLLVQPLQFGAPTIKLILHLKQTSGGDYLVIEVKLSDRKEVHCVNARFSLVDADGRFHTKGKGTIFFKKEDCLKFKPFIKLKQHSENYFPDDVLFLKCELKTSYGVVINRLENYVEGLSTTVESAKSSSGKKSNEGPFDFLIGWNRELSILENGNDCFNRLTATEKCRLSDLQQDRSAFSSSSSEEVTLLNRHSNLKRKRRVLLVILDAIASAFF